MKILNVLFLLFVLNNLTKGQSSISELKFGKYEGIEIIVRQIYGDTSTMFKKYIDESNNHYGKKTLVINSNGTFYLFFPDRHPRASHVQTRRTEGYWIRNQDTLILNSKYKYSNFIKVQESKNKKIDSGKTKIQISYKRKNKISFKRKKNKYYPSLSISIKDQTIETNYNPWTFINLDKIEEFKINRYGTISDMEWRYKTLNKNSNCFKIFLIGSIEGNDFVVENYKLLIEKEKLKQIDEKLFDFSYFNYNSDL